MNDLVSIITPSYNCQKFVADTIDSVLAQGYDNWEMIIVDDASTDESITVIEKYAKQDERIKLIKLAENGGAAMARNKALEHATGRYIAFLDSDDIWYADKLNQQVKFMADNNHPISFTSYATMNEDGQDLNHIIKVVNSLTLEQYLKNTIIGFSTAMIDKSQMKNGIKFLNIRIRQDTNLWITLLKQGYKAYGLNQTLVRYRIHSNSISANKVKAAKQVWNLYFNIHKFGLFKSAYYFIHYAGNAVKKRIFS
uniref:Glycosyl transferase n=1 Tax=OCS116 cluster bacterium TaxID=2030921 RepID=A0A2A4YTY3_9PROT